MLHAFEHFVFGFEAAVFKPPNNAAATQPETDFQYQEKNTHGIKIKALKRLRIEHKLHGFNDEHTN